MSSPVRPAHAWYRWIWASLDWLYPPRCAGCDQPGSRWCVKCQREVRRLDPPLCPTCSQPVSISGKCSHCRISNPCIQRVRAWGEFGGALRRAVHALKYRRNLALGECLASHLGDLLVEEGWQVDLIVPVPLSSSRLRTRGYNQAALLAYPLSLAMGISYRPKVLMRTRETQTQVGLSVASRRANVQGAFAADPSVAKKRVLVIDDVITTGATLHECASALMQSGAKEVYGMALARAV